MNERGYQVLPLCPNTWAIDMKMVRAFLVCGDTSALLIDTGAGGVNIQAAVGECTGLPVRVVNTHSHFDHISGNGAFEMQFVHPLELGSLAKAGFEARPVGDGSGFDLGSRIIQVVSLPGHSPGSIGLWDAEAGLLFAGDTVSVGRPVFLSLDGASVEAYTRSLERILMMERDENGGTLRRIFCAHGNLEADIGAVRRLKTLAEQVLSGEAKCEPLPEQFAALMGPSVSLCRHEDVSVLAG